MSLGLMLGASLIGGGIQALGASRAARSQASAARDAADAQVEAAQIGADALRDNTRMGLDAQREMAGLGLREQRTGRDIARRDISRGNRDARTFVYGGALQAENAIRSGFNETRGAIQDDTGRMIAENDEAFGYQEEQLSPFASAGRNALSGLMFELGLGDRPDNYRGFQATPGYEFARSEGMRAIDGSAASRGNLFSGATLENQQQFGTGLADQTYSRFMDRLTGQAGMGQQASNALSGFRGQNAANNNAARGARMAGMSNAIGARSAGLANIASNRGSSLANMTADASRGRANAAMGFGQSAGNTFANLGNTQATAFNNLGTNLAANAQNMGAAQAQGFQNVGNARAAGAVGFGNAINDGITNALGSMSFQTGLQAMNPGYNPQQAFGNVLGGMFRRNQPAMPIQPGMQY